MEKRHTIEEHNTLLYTALFLIIGLLFASSGNIDGMFSKEEQCRLVKNPISQVSYCRGASSSQYCVWDEEINKCKFVNYKETCRSFMEGYCSRPGDACIPYKFSRICAR